MIEPFYEEGQACIFSCLIKKRHGPNKHLPLLFKVRVLVINLAVYAIVKAAQNNNFIFYSKIINYCQLKMLDEMDILFVLRNENYILK